MNVRPSRPGRRRAATLAIALIAATVPAAIAPATAAAGAAAEPSVSVIVRHDGSARADAAVARAGGVVTARLRSLDALVVRAPHDTLSSLRNAPGVLAVTADRALKPHNTASGVGVGVGNTMSQLAASTGARGAWRQGVTGAGVGVALIDTGVVPVAGLTSPGKIINGPDLSFESQTDDRRHLDTYGHGTHLAGIIAGRDAGAPADTGAFAGVAPGAHVINVKVGSFDGAADVSQVIAAIDWVVAHRDDPRLNIRVLNLAFGTDGAQDPRLDPLSYAVDVAWRHGIVVTVAVGNQGARRPVGMPAANPRVLAVGAVDNHGTVTTRDDTVAPFSASGARSRSADIHAPGVRVVSLRDAGSFLDLAFPQGRHDDRFFRGSGTSQATAFVSGAAALLLQKRPDLTPDQIKALLTRSDTAVRGVLAASRGAGQLDIAAALRRLDRGAVTGDSAPAGWEATGLGSLDASRGTHRLVDPASGVVLSGEQDIFGQTWNPQVWAAAANQGQAWTDGAWNNSTWTGSGWTGTSWGGTSWGGTSWGGTSWGGTSWGGTSWGGTSWGGTSWGGTSWGGTSWGGTSWGGTSWGGTSWGGASWG
ncbi:S8 family serine peptidase [Pilimelia columellifera]|uniref:Peptidase S8/S53 domain-containing protein n=1 Tax=Pilimelia columellifera subsp. columellifera TaxID=706583 RepID=A0ABN3NHC7_9ACTN